MLLAERGNRNGRVLDIGFPAGRCNRDFRDGRSKCGRERNGISKRGKRHERPERSERDVHGIKPDGKPAPVHRMYINDILMASLERGIDQLIDKCLLNYRSSDRFAIRMTPNEPAYP